ncbi:MAG: 23S rRNA (adenine(2503)-C(2))-methyltransferase RlmN [Desulfocurvibacter africanus]
MDTKINLLDLSLDELRGFIAELREPRFRAEQVWQWMWQKGVSDFEEMSNVSKALRTKLAEHAVIRPPTIDTVRESDDGTVKFLLRLADGALIETVLLPSRTHYTQCLSTQVGCAMGCAFCSTGTMGLARNLAHSEICGQVLLGRKWLEQKNSQDKGERSLRNLVFMGMGEPLMNYDTLVKSLHTLRDDKAFGFSSRRMTVSTAGVPGRMTELVTSGLARLAVSLHAPTQELRERIMPKAARMHPLPALMEELKKLPLRPQERTTFEYILIGGLNDTPQHARELVRLLSHVRAKINLIACNPAKDSPFAAPTMEAIEAFQQVLRDKGLVAMLRKSKGQDIEAACGQLVTQKQKEQARTEQADA